MDEATREAIYEALQKVLPDPQRGLEEKRRYDANLVFALEHTEEWRALYPDHWIVVYDCKLVVAAPTEDELFESAERANVPLAKSYLKFLTKEKYLLML